LFSSFKREDSGITDKDTAILQIKTQRDRLTQYTKQIQIVIERETELAKELMKEKKRDQAKLCLMKKKHQINLLEQVRGNIYNLEQLSSTIEWRIAQNEIIERLAMGRDVLQELQAQASVEDVEDIMLDTEEAIQIQNEIFDLLGGKLTEDDNEEILAELEELMGLEEDIIFPEIPVHNVEIRVTGTETPQSSEGRTAIPV